MYVCVSSFPSSAFHCIALLLSQTSYYTRTCVFVCNDHTYTCIYEYKYYTTTNTTGEFWKHIFFNHFPMWQMIFIVVFVWIKWSIIIIIIINHIINSCPFDEPTLLYTETYFYILISFSNTKFIHWNKQPACILFAYLVDWCLSLPPTLTTIYHHSQRY